MKMMRIFGLGACALLLAALMAAPATADDGPDPLAATGSMGVLQPLDVLRMVAKARGKVVLINFWASWCAPCRAERVELMAVREAFSPEDLLLVGLSVDEDPMAYAKFVGDTEFNYPVRRAGDAVARLYKIGSIPRLVGYGPDGSLALDHEGLVEAEELMGAVRSLLAKR